MKVYMSLQKSSWPYILQVGVLYKVCPVMLMLYAVGEAH